MLAEDNVPRRSLSKNEIIFANCEEKVLTNCVSGMQIDNEILFLGYFKAT